MSSTIYLDCNATTPIRPEVIELVATLMAKPHNASSIHSMGREGHKHIEQAREIIGKLVNAPAAQITFNSGATEGNNTVLKHFKDERVLISNIEHASIFGIQKTSEKIQVTSDGAVDLEHLETLLKQTPKAALVSVMIVNNETGVIQPIKQVSDLVHKYGALLHCDGVQAAGRIPIDMQEMGIDFLTLSAHKLGGPQGVGALITGLCGITPVLLEGGGQEKMARAGTQNVAGITGFGLAIEMAGDWKAYQEQLLPLQEKLETGIKTISPEARIFGCDAQRAANTTMFSVAGLSSEILLMSFDLENICLSSGSACSSGSVQASHVLGSMGASCAETSGALRVSMSWATSESDINAFLTAWGEIYQRMQLKRP